MRSPMAAIAIVLLTSAVARAADPSMHRQKVDYAPIIAELSREIPQKMRREKVVGLGVALVDGERVIWSQGFGMADRDADRPVNRNTLFQVGDITKAITAIGVLQLVQSGHFGLDQAITELIPGIRFESRSDPPQSPTVRQLLSHLGGVSNQRLAGSNLPAPTESLPALQRVPLTHPAGQIYSYSHLGYTVLGHLIERYSGQPYAAWVRARVLRPLGMDGCDFTLDGSRQELIAMGHDRKRRTQRNYYSRDVAALGLLCPVEDVARLLAWMNRDDTRPILERDWVDEMLRVQNSGVALDLDNITGLSWQRTNTGRHRVARIARQNTAMIHVRGVVLAALDERIGVVVMANSSTAFDLVMAIAGDSIDAMLKKGYGIEPPPPRDQDIPDRIPPFPGVADTPMRERYSTGLGMIEFSGDGDRLKMSFLGRGFSANRRADGWYEIAYRLLGILDVRINLLEDILIRPARMEGRDLLLSWYQGRQFLLGSSLPPARPHPELAALAGRYALTNPDMLSEAIKLDSIELDYEAGRLVASYRLPIFIPLHPQLPLDDLGGGRFVIPGLGVNLGEPVAIRGDPPTLEYSGYRFKRLRD